MADSEHIAELKQKFEWFRAQPMHVQKRMASQRTQYRGVFRNVAVGGFDAAIRYRNKWVQLGTFQTAEDAAREYNQAARKYYGERAIVNMVDEVDEEADELSKIEASSEFKRWYENNAAYDEGVQDEQRR